jgi:hypothetical protein
MRGIGLGGAIVIAVMGFGGASFAADSETAVAADAGTAVAVDTGTPAATEAVTASSAVSTTPQAAPAPAGPVFGYVGRADKAAMNQITVAQAALSSQVGDGLAVAAAKGLTAALIDQHGLQKGEASPTIQDPSEDLARAIAGGLAKARGGSMASGPIALDQWRGSDRKAAVQANGARYVVEVAPVRMTLSYFALDWRHYDLILSTTAKVIDTADGHVMSKANCTVSRDHSAQLAGRRELLANHAEKLNAVIATKTSACLAKLQTGLDLPVSNSQPLTIAASTPDAASASGAWSAALVSDPAVACDADKARYAAQLGVPCASLGAKVMFTQTSGSTIQ